MSYDPLLLRDDLIRDEGYRNTPYRDTLGHLTVGVGHLLLPGESTERWSDKAILTTLDADIRKAERVLDLVYPPWREVDDDRQRALMNLAFNLGNRLAQFKRFWHYVRLGNWNRAADELVSSRWYTQVRSRGPRVVVLIRFGKNVPTSA